MIALFLLATAFFTSAAFFSLQVREGPVSPFQRFFSFETSIIFHNLFIFFLFLFVAVLLFVTTYPRHKNHSLHRKATHSLFTIFLILLGSLFFSFILLCSIAFLQLNIYALLINSNPTAAGVVTDKNKIIAYFKTTTVPPHVIASDADQHAELLAVASVATGTTNFYGKYILPLIPSFLTIPIHKPESSLLLIDNTLLFTKISPQEIGSVSPYVGYLFLASYFQDRVIKRYPQVSIYTRQEYVEKRQRDVAQTVLTMRKQLRQLETVMGSVSAQIAFDSGNVATLSAVRTRLTQQKATDVQTCKAGKISAGCQDVLADWNGQIDAQTKLIDAAEEKLGSDRKKLDDYTAYRDFFIKRIPVVDASKENLPYEAGVFTPKNSIRLALDATSPHGVADYLEVLVHEYLHYASYVSEDQKFSDLFFEEGLTEYFARQVVKNDLQTTTNVAYPVFVKILEGMTQMLTESELADLYFSKNQQELEAALDRVYGDNFYSRNRIRFATLQYAVDPKETLKVANELMRQIGGKQLTEKDLQSTSTHF